MPTSQESLTAGTTVLHTRFGSGKVVLDQNETVIVRFGQQLESVSRGELEARVGIEERFAAPVWEPAVEVIHRIQALAVQSLHDEWGVFAASRIELLPHQLWVCRQVNGAWPARFLVADDVGLGKTVEAGMILSPLLGHGRIKRLLILCPANLVGQWQDRMDKMFGIKLVQYSPEADTSRSRFWDIHPCVVASFHTLRNDHKDRHKRMLQSEPWDMVIVDEAHHLNNDLAAGPTLGYRLLRDLEEARRIVSMLFFTGTPHRGKDYNFLSLLSLLRPEWFRPERPIAEQLTHLPDVMIRNNKASATDLLGNRLFKPLQVESENYTYSPDEEYFYNLMTEFIVSGQAYARGLNRTQSEAVKLVLVTLQKLASSSVAAVRRAISRRIARVETGRVETAALQTEFDRLSERGGAEDLDRLSELEETLAESQFSLQLMEGEEPALRELKAAADRVTEETKIVTILRSLKTRFVDRSVLFFTEYKATQALLAGALMAEFGRDAVAFINGDGFLAEVMSPEGTLITLTEDRESAAERFNDGRVRFLISTEAAGEGIDLQRSCHTLIHVDLPWNPMRLHQRVGRLYRYGQKETVEVRIFHNPDTVESLIWEQLNDKLTRIGAALAEGMDEPEEIGQLVLGMTAPRMFSRLFAEAPRRRERLKDWFDRETATFGGEDVASTVRTMLGNVKRFDFGSVSQQIPQITLAALRPVFELALHLGGRRPTVDDSEDSLSFLTPDDWRDSHPAIRASYSSVTFDWKKVESNRDGHGVKPLLLGVGNPLMDAALRRGRESAASVAAIPADVLGAPLFVFRIYSRETTDAAGPQPLVAGVRVPLGKDEPVVITDAALLEAMNALPVRRPVLIRALPHPPSATPEQWNRCRVSAENVLTNALGNKVIHRFRFPATELLCVLWPVQAD